MTVNTPNVDQANEGSEAGVLKSALNNWLLNSVDDMVPCKVISYNDKTNRATLQPLVMMGGTGGQKVSRARVDNIPVFRFGGGGFFMRFPIKPGNLGWLKANDNDISLIMQGGGSEDWPNTTRLHSFSDAMFFPDTFKQWVINDANIDAAVWQSLDGLACIALADQSISLSMGRVSIVISAEGVDITSPPGTLRHNGINVGDTHSHFGPPTAPLGPVSPTGTPIPS